VATGERVPLDDGRWVAIMAILAALERRFEGITAEAHDIVAGQHALADVVRLHGRRTEPALRAAYADAERHLGVIAVVAPKVVRRKKREKE
jgi:hypothetical protein